MQLSQFSFDLPPELIAQSPAVPRDSARLLVYNRQDDSIVHSTVKEIGCFLPARSLLIANNSQVRKSRLFARTDSGKSAELLILEAGQPNHYYCLVGGAKVRPGDKLAIFSDAGRTVPTSLSATVTSFDPHPGMSRYLIHFESSDNASLEAAFERLGHTPLPPYIKEPTSRDDQYQTVFASKLGSAAAPTAGLHFTPELLADLTERGIEWGEVTLHVGLGTFLPLRAEEITENQLHSEQTWLAPELARRIWQKQQAGERIAAVGTTSTRTLESHSQAGQLVSGELATSMFIYPGYRFQTVNALLTNFHLPKSSLLLLVSAFLGNHSERERPLLEEAEMIRRLHRIYQEAIAERYRFFSFGDAMLIL